METILSEWEKVSQLSNCIMTSWLVYAGDRSPNPIENLTKFAPSGNIN